VSESFTTYAALGLFAVIPLAFMVMTSFLKLSVVFSILRNAIGLGQVPSGTIITVLAAILSLYVMAPVGQEMAEAAAPSIERVDWEAPMRGDSKDAVIESLESGLGPLKEFLKRNATQRERSLFLDLARQARAPEHRADVGPDDLLVILPAFIITELAEAFQIGFLVFIPFLIVDLVVANVLLALGMQTMSPTTISLPFKLLLFVIVDGWFLLSRALVLGYS